MFKRVNFTWMALVLFAAVSVSCSLDGKRDDDINTPGDLPNLLLGEWRADLDGYSIKASTLRYIDDFGFGYTGTISFVSNYGSDSGVIIVNYTVPPSVGYNGNPYTAVYYRNLTGNAVQLANVIDLSDYSSADTTSLEEAKEKFTRSEMVNYVDWSLVSPFSKTPAQ